MRTQPLWEQPTRIMASTRRLPETEGIPVQGLIAPIRQLAWTRALRANVPSAHPATEAATEVARALWEAVASYGQACPRSLPRTICITTVALYRAIVDGDLQGQVVALAALVDALVDGPRWIACAEQVDSALGQAERWLRFALPEER